MFYLIARQVVGLFLKIFFRLKVYGRENVPQEGGFILASNHVSYLDPPTLGVASTRPLYFMARHDLFKNRAFGLLLKAVHSFPLKRSGGDPSALREAIRRLKNGKALVIFPEGRRSVTGRFGAAQPGVGFLGITAGVPILPAYIEGTGEALPKGARFIKPGRIRVYFGKIIEPKKLKFSGGKKEMYERLSNYVLNQISRLNPK